jgi:hypothetical protein
MQVKLNNTFHNTYKVINLKPGRNVISARRLHEWKRNLCCDDCICSGIDGTRGDSNGVKSYDLPSDWTAEWRDDYDKKTGKQQLIINIYQLNINSNQ